MSSTANVALLQEMTTAGHLQVHSIECEQPLSFPVTSRSGYKISNLGNYRGPNFLQYSHVLVMDVGSYPVQLTARTTTTSSAHHPICPFKCSGDLMVQNVTKCEDYGCSCFSSGPLHLLLLTPHVCVLYFTPA
jgi:hypothetical protein